jgi:hypothetical protein
MADITMCPHCDGLLYIDPDGDIATADHLVEPVEQPEPEQKNPNSIGGFRVIEATPDWKKDSYYFNSQMEPPRQDVMRMNVMGREVIPSPPPPSPLPVIPKDSPLVAKAEEPVEEPYVPQPVDPEEKAKLDEALQKDLKQRNIH